jgi:hypothetical protein
MKIPLILASGGGAIQGGIILLGLLMAFLAIPFACYAAFKKKKERSLVSIAVCVARGFAHSTCALWLAAYLDLLGCLYPLVSTRDLGVRHPIDAAKTEA